MKTLVPLRTSETGSSFSVDGPVTDEPGYEGSPGSQFSLMVSAADVCWLGLRSVQTALGTPRNERATEHKQE